MRRNQKKKAFNCGEIKQKDFEFDLKMKRERRDSLVVSYYRKFVGRNLNKEEKERISRFSKIADVPERPTISPIVIEKLCDYIEVFGSKLKSLFVTTAEEGAIIALYNVILKHGLCIFF